MVKRSVQVICMVSHVYEVLKGLGFLNCSLTDARVMRCIVMFHEPLISYACAVISKSAGNVQR